MHEIVQEYINRINAKDHTMKDILLDGYELTDEDIAPLMQLISDPANKDIVGNITEIFLSRNKLTNITIPGNLNKLIRLSISENLLTDIVIHENLRALQDLVLNNNKLTSITIPDRLVKLRTLSVSENNLTTIDIPGSLGQLQILCLNNNCLTDVSIPKGLINLKKLVLSRNKLSNINIPNTFIFLQELYLDHNELTTFKIPVNSHILRILYLGTNRLTKIIIPASLDALQTLDLGENNLHSISIPGSLKSLTWLFLQDNELTNIMLHEGSLALYQLNLLRNKLSKVSIAVLHAFKIKHLYDNMIVNIEDKLDSLQEISDKFLDEDLSVDLKKCISSLTVENQRRYLLNCFKGIVSWMLIIDAKLNDKNISRQKIMFLAVKTFAPDILVALYAQRVEIKNILNYLSKVFTCADSVSLTDRQKKFFNLSRQAITEYQNNYNAMDDAAIIKSFEEDFKCFVGDLQDVLEWLWGCDFSKKDEIITRQFAKKVKILVGKYGFDKEALVAQDMQMLMPLLINKEAHKPKNLKPKALCLS
jgi:hypothetical protein